MLARLFEVNSRTIGSHIAHDVVILQVVDALLHSCSPQRSMRLAVNDVVTDCEFGQLAVELDILLRAFPLRRLRQRLAVCLRDVEYIDNFEAAKLG